MHAYPNPNATVTCTYREFMDEVMKLVPNFRFIPQGHIPVGEIAEQAALNAFCKEQDAPLTRSVLITFRKYGAVIFKP